MGPIWASSSEIAPTNVDPSMLLQGEDYDLKERVNAELSSRLGNTEPQPGTAAPPWLSTTA